MRTYVCDCETSPQNRRRTISFQRDPSSIKLSVLQIAIGLRLCSKTQQLSALIFFLVEKQVSPHSRNHVLVAREKRTKERRTAQINARTF